MDLQLFPRAHTLVEQGCTFVVAAAFFPALSTAPILLLATGSLGTVCATITNSPVVHRIARIVNRTAIAALLGTFLHPLIHEAGHATLAFLIFKNPEISITANLSLAATSYELNGLTCIGSLLGSDLGTIVIAMGGCLASLTWGILAAPPILIYSGMARLFSEGIYALSALYMPWNPAHDYQFLRVYAQIHPLAPAILLLGAFGYKLMQTAAIDLSVRSRLMSQ